MLHGQAFKIEKFDEIDETIDTLETQINFKRELEMLHYPVEVLNFSNKYLGMRKFIRLAAEKLDASGLLNQDKAS
jgi:hypothetical protein